MASLLDCFTEQHDLSDELDEKLRWILAAAVLAVVLAARVPVVAIQARVVQRVQAVVAVAVVVVVAAILIQRNGFL